MQAEVTKILVAADDPHMLLLISRTLQLEGYSVLAVPDGQQALLQVEDWTPDLVVLDLTQHRLDSLQVCEQIRQRSTMPILLITPRRQEREVIRGLELGADDYLLKPFTTDELLTHVQVTLRLAQWVINDSALQPPLECGQIVLQRATPLVSLAGRAIPLTPLEHRLLLCLLEQEGTLVLQDYLVEQIWGSAYSGEYRLLRSAMDRLRRKLEPDTSHPRYLFTRAGIGYLLSARSEGDFL